jgi:inositol 1,4,5-triphosphate receptor type 3
MIVNKHLIGSSHFNNFCANIDYSIIEIINYIFIVVQNVLILWRFYKKSDLSYEEYYTFDQSKVKKLHLENMIIAIVQDIFLIFFLVLWYIFKFINSCQQNIMEEYNRPFVGKRIGEDEKIPQVVVDYFQEKNVSTMTFFKEVNRDLTKWQKFYIYVFSIHILNREIIMLVLSLILNIFYHITRNPLFLVFQVLFIANIISTLFDIIYAIKLKWINIILLLLFDFLCVYVFMWFPFFFFPYFFYYDDVLIPDSQERINEGFCFSSLQCYLFILSRGSLSNGGISNDIERISYKKDAGFFIGRFFYDVIFFLLISLYIGKMFLSFIIDTFGDLRNTNAENTHDKKNICFICQISRDECLMKNIDFDKHVDKVHNIWNYVYFLNYLYVNNPFNFNWIENSVWEKLQEQGINWIPLEKD